MDNLHVFNIRKNPSCLQYFGLLVNYFICVHFYYFILIINKTRINYLHSLANHINNLTKYNF